MSSMEKYSLTEGRRRGAAFGNPGEPLGSPPVIVGNVNVHSILLECSASESSRRDRSMNIVNCRRDQQTIATY